MFKDRVGVSITRMGVSYTRVCVVDTQDRVGVPDPANPLPVPGAGAAVERRAARRLRCRPRRQGQVLSLSACIYLGAVYWTSSSQLWF